MHSSSPPGRSEASSTRRDYTESPDGRIYRNAEHSVMSKGREGLARMQFRYSHHARERMAEQAVIPKPIS